MDLVPCSVCCTAVPSRIRPVVSMPFTTKPPEAMCCRGAWDEVRANQGATGVDGVTIEHIEASGLAAFVTNLAADLRGRNVPPRTTSASQHCQAGSTRQAPTAQHSNGARSRSDDGSQACP